jgi:ABC-type polysaccharide/polyol phosphate export permease
MALLIEAKEALRDIREGWTLRNGWWLLSRQTLYSSYRRTSIGPFWITIQQVSYVVGLSLLYSQLFKIETRQIIPIVAYGISIWTLMSTTISSASLVYISNSNPMKTATLPCSFYLYLYTSQNLLVYSHSAFGLVLIPILVKHEVNTVSILTAPLSIVVIAINGFSLGLWLGPLSARYRDLKAMIPMILQLLVFLSPIFWTIDQLGKNLWIVNFNPIAWMVEAFRSPLIGGNLKILIWIKLIVLSTINFTVGFFVFTKTKKSIGYWL